jgi:plastocyanin
MRTPLFSMVTLAALGGIAHAGGGGKVTGIVTVTDPGDKAAIGAEVVIYIVGPKDVGDKEDAATLRQKGRAFEPDLVAVTAGGKVTFPNDDAILHNVFSQSEPRKFDLGSFKKGDSKTKDFPKPGVVDVYCNIHPEMASTILVVPNKFHTRTSAGGVYTLADVPPGDWTLFAYTRRSQKPVSQKIHVDAGGETKVDLALKRSEEPEHLNKYGEKYKPGSPNTYK